MDELQEEPTSSDCHSDSERSMDNLIEEWSVRGNKWWTEPEISEERQHRLLALIRTVPPDDNYFPLALEKLSRADVEWLIVNAYQENVKLLEVMKKVIEQGKIGIKFDLDTIRELRKKMFSRVYQSEFVDLRGAILTDVNLRGIPLYDVLLDHADLTSADLREANLYQAHLSGARLDYAKIQNVTLDGADLQGASLEGTFLEQANLRNCHLEGAKLTGTHLAGAILDGVFFDPTTKLDRLELIDSVHGSIIFGDIYWNGVNFSNVEWSKLKILGDETWADEVKKRTQEVNRAYIEKMKEYDKKITHSAARSYKRAAMANYKLAKALQEQGLSDEARRFAYRSYVLRRKAMFHQRNMPSYLGSLFLDLISGYGYKKANCFGIYVIIISMFMVIYHFLGTHLGWQESLVISMTAFHGRGFFPGTFSPGDPIALFGACEALIGLIVEVTLIATLTQRLFSK